MRLLRSSVLALLAFVAACGGDGPPVAAPSAVAAAPEGTVASADGVPIYYRSAGRGEPAVVLVHGWCFSSDEWADAMGVLAATHRVIALDLAGHGRSGKGRKDWTVPSFVGDIRAVVNHLGIGKAIVVGHSMSGAIAVEAAVELPDRIVGVIPIDALQDVGERDDPAENAKFFATMRASFGPTSEALVRRIVPKTAAPDLVKRIVAVVHANDPAIAVPILESNAAFPVKDAFAKVKVPIIAINADLSPTNVAGNQALAPQFQVRIIEGVGHWPMLEAPQRFNLLLKQAVSDIAVAAR
jgi:pimeloyl-ACP methyl ester carboxylesterase